MTDEDTFNPTKYATQIGDAFSGTVPDQSEWKRLAGQVLTLSAPPPMDSPDVVYKKKVLNYRNMRVMIEGFISAIQTRDGGWIVQVPPRGAKITAVGATSSPDASLDTHPVTYDASMVCGWALNWRGNVEANVTPLLHNYQQPLPIDVVPEDALVVCRQSVNFGSRGDYPFAGPGRSYVDQAMAIVFVSWTPIPGMLRPPAIGNSDLTRFFRSQPIVESALNVAGLPSVIDYSTLPVNWQDWGAGETTEAFLTELFNRFCGEFYAGWSTDNFTPDHQHPGYGSALAGVVSLGLLRLCSTDTTAQKTPLAYGMAQWGFDLAGAFADGRVHIAGGGHAQGRKALIILFGKLTGITYLQDPTSVLGNVFQEDQAYFQDGWWDGDWTYCWRFNNNSSPANGSLIGSPPSTWGDITLNDHGTWIWQFRNYMEQCVGSQMGSVLAMELMDLTSEFGENIAGMTEQYINGLDPTPLQDLADAGIGDIRWGTDITSCGKGATTPRVAWDIHHTPFSF